MNDEIKLKRCSEGKVCVHPDGPWLPETLEYFRKSFTGKYGLRSQCRACERSKSRLFYAENVAKKIEDYCDGKRCSRGDACVHPDGPCLPATPEYFRKSSTGRNGLRSRCKACERAIDRKYYMDHTDERREATRTYYARHDEIIRSKRIMLYWKNPEEFRRQRVERYQNDLERTRSLNRFWYAQNAKKRRQQAKSYYWQQRDSLLDKQRQRRANNPEHERALNRKYYLRHAEKKRAYTRRWRQTPEGKICVKVYNWQRVSRLRSMEFTFTPAQWFMALDYFQGQCAVCGKKPDFWTVLAADHWYPLSKGGPTNVYNIIPLCHSRQGGEGGCNNRKSNRDPVEFLETTFGIKKAKSILSRVEEYFAHVKERENGES